MGSESFKDILARFLEEKSDSAEDFLSQQPVFLSQTTDIPFVFIDTLTPARPRGKATYGGVRPKEKLDSLSRNSAIEERRPLSLEGQKALDTLLRLGALDLDSGLTGTLVKKAYRRLLKFYHPDHYPLDLSSRARAQRTEQLLELQQAFKTLSFELTRP